MHRLRCYYTRATLTLAAGSSTACHRPLNLVSVTPARTDSCESPSSLQCHHLRRLPPYFLAIPRKRGRSRSDLPDSRPPVMLWETYHSLGSLVVRMLPVASQQALQRPLTVWGSNGLNWYVSRQTEPVRGRSTYILKCIRERDVV